MTSSRTMVLAPRLDKAKAWCLAHRIAPHGRNTAMRSTPDSVRGLSFATGDRLVVLPGTSWAAEALFPALLTAPGGEDVLRELKAFTEWLPGNGPAEFSHVFGAAT